MGLVLDCAELVETGWNDDTSYRESEKRSCGLSDCLVEELLCAAKSSEEETHSKDEKEIGEDTANEGGLHHQYFIVCKSDDCYDHLDGVSEIVSWILLKERCTYPNEAFRSPPKLSPT